MVALQRAENVLQTKNLPPSSFEYSRSSPLRNTEKRKPRKISIIWRKSAAEGEKNTALFSSGSISKLNLKQYDSAYPSIVVIKYVTDKNCRGRLIMLHDGAEND